MADQFNYHEAFSRNIGWVTEGELDVLRSKRIAIAGLGGVGSVHLLTLSRLGIGNFTIADMDIFELPNFNRQAGASMSHLHRPKVEVMREMARDINPELDIRCFEQGVDQANMDAFLEDVDLYVDSLDFFALEARKAMFAACAEKGIPAITAAPIGMGVALLNFLPGKMTFEQYFRLEGRDEQEQLLRFLLGLSPAMLQMRYVADDTRVDMKGKKVPSTPMACDLCAGIAGTQALKILLNRGNVIAAPRGMHFDAYRQKLATTWRPWGNNNPVQRLLLAVARRRYAATLGEKAATSEAKQPETAVERILDLARWAPSGDNEQPWRFELINDHHFVVYGHDTRDWCVYDLDGRASQIAMGALLETISIAASGEGFEARFEYREDSPESSPVIDVHLTKNDQGSPNPLLAYIKARVTQRRPLKTVPLTASQKQRLEALLDDGYEVIWIEGRKPRWQMAKLLWKSAWIRLTTPEGYEVHRNTIEWGVRFSEDRIPEPAVGADPLTMKIMRWALGSWNRIRFLNRFAAGTWLPRLQMDLLAGYCCGAHFLIAANEPLASMPDYWRGGRMVQRFWLEANRLGLQFQPEMTPLIFSRFVASGIEFTQMTAAQERAGAVWAALKGGFLEGDIDANQLVFMGRLGHGSSPTSRSVRKPSENLLR